MSDESNYSITAKLQNQPEFIKNSAVDMYQILKLLNDITFNYYHFICGISSIETECEEMWSSYIEDMCKLSSVAKGIVFTCIRRGEQSADVECTYFFEGKYQPAILSFSPFIESKLISP